MRVEILALIVLSLHALGASAPPTWAQTAAPGAICQTDAGWCWAPIPGLPGQPCMCPTSTGNVPGILQ